jgi:hypothetical protein
MVVSFVFSQSVCAVLVFFTGYRLSAFAFGYGATAFASFFVRLAEP